MNTFTIEPPTEQDIPTLVRWGRTHQELRASNEDPWYSEAALAAWRKEPGNDILLTAKDNGKPVGMILVHWMRDWAYVSSLFVWPAYRNRGVASKLLDRAEEIVSARGIATLELVVEIDNGLAREFYRKRGYQQGFQFHWMAKKLSGKNQRTSR